MINRESILQWSSHVPWSDNVQVEQDLIISRVLTAIFSDEFLAAAKYRDEMWALKEYLKVWK